MLRIVQSKSAEQAKGYYVQELTRDGYYTEGQERKGLWHGKGAELLGLEGEVGSDAFYDLCDNRDPAVGGPLTQRTKAERTVGYDANFHAPKSLSVLYAHTRDERIVTALREAVGETMREMEMDMQTRVRLGGVQEKRYTGNMVWAEFVHMTARPVDGKVDPHLHAHCFVFNATHDQVEDRWKAGHFADLKKDAPYHEAAFHSRLAAGIGALGYGVEAKGKFWEVEGVPQSAIDRFSQRKEQIEALAEKLGITDAAEKDRLGATSREKKIKMSMEALSAHWASRMTSEETATLDAVQHAARGHEGRTCSGDICAQALDHALNHVYERASVVPERKILESAMRFGVGRVSVDQVKAALSQDTRILSSVVGNEKCCTTRAIRDEEAAVVAFAKDTRNSLDPIKSGPHEFKDQRLNEGQRAAVEHILSSHDQVTMVRGRPGTGKTSLMAETVGAMNAAGYGVVALAPTAESSRGALRQAGFPNADTVESFLQSEAKQQKARGQILWVDEAGLLSVGAMRRVVDVAKARGCRVVFVGDSNQHRSVARGDAMRLLERHAGLRVPEVTEIVRQTEAGYRSAVGAMSSGDIKKAFATLEKMNAFVVNDDLDRLHARVAEDYVHILKEGKEPLIIAPQHQEGRAITDKVRENLRGQEWIRGEDRSVLRLTSAKLTEAERADPRHYQAGQVVQFTQNVPGFRRGERYDVLGRRGGDVAVQNIAGEQKKLPLKFSSRFELYTRDQIALATGDKVRITNNSYGKKGQRLDNGSMHTVAKVHANGEIELKNKTILAAGFGHLTHGYYTTSHNSQSKTVDWALLAQSSLSFNAASREQMNVSLSRGREGIRIYTDDKLELRASIARSAARESALDMLGSKGTEKKSAEKREVIMSDMNRWVGSWRRGRERANMSERSRETDFCKEARGVTKGRKRGFGLEISL